MCRADVRDSVMKKMRDAGCRGFKFGVESGDDDVLKKTKKGITTKQVRDFVKLTKKYKMRTYGTFMFGLPGDTKESMQKTLDFAVELDLDGFQTSITTPFPGTEFYEMAKKNKWLIEHDFSKYDGNSGKSVISYPQLSNEEINRMFEKSKTSVMRFKWEYLYSYPLAAFKRDGLKGVANLILKDSPVYMKRMIQKNLLKKKITYS
jgi:radical SAM superfamily enzyme YgiQ (UPF0313 family)